MNIEIRKALEQDFEFVCSLGVNKNGRFSVRCSEKR